MRRSPREEPAAPRDTGVSNLKGRPADGLGRVLAITMTGAWSFFSLWAKPVYLASGFLLGAFFVRHPERVLAPRQKKPRCRGTPELLSGRSGQRLGDRSIRCDGTQWPAVPRQNVSPLTQSLLVRAADLRHDRPRRYQRHRPQAGAAPELGGIGMPGPLPGVRRIEYPQGKEARAFL
jgi:hypothetical protein